ncbi:hypothetical protein AVEN_212288-1 [Araneus ventricosus]|uniref:Uncharacterized protein n=1 Tax=Araneus ventricosus TaxID=182803 RepID=A0A4Y2WLJ5_ARAVE|nr:hypothetical protein AVEN_212288-1 [Araneus ventricosus]
MEVHEPRYVINSRLSTTNLHFREILQNKILIESPSLNNWTDFATLQLRAINIMEEQLVVESATVAELKIRMTAALEADMLAKVWDEFDYHIDICRASKDGHIEHL